MRIVVVGSNGQLGTDLVKTLGEEHEVVGLTHREIEVADYSSCQIIREHRPDIVINTAAFHKTDQCEDEPLKAFSVNAIGARNIAAVSKGIGATTVYISTDYVFDGSKNKPYTEDDPPNPINTYGISKLAGELFTKQNPKHYIIRTASLFGVAGASGKGGNFVETMIAKAKSNDQISVVDDIWMSPTYTKDAGLTIKKIVDGKLPYGVYHVVNQGTTTWFQFAKEIFQILNLKPKLVPIKTDQLNTKAQRPSYSALETIKLQIYGIYTRHWREALYAYLEEKDHIKSRNYTVT